MKPRTPKKVTLTRETLHALDRSLAEVAAAGKIPCSIRICPLTNPSYEPCTQGCSQSC